MVRAEPMFWLLLALALVLVPIKLILGWLIAVFIHELFHILALCALRCRIYDVHLSLSGVEIVTQPLSLRRELLCAAAGPVGSFLLLLIAKWLPIVAVCGFLHGAYNLLPLYPMDGGRICRCMISRFFSRDQTRKLIYITRVCIYSVLIAGSVILFKISGSIVSLAAAIFLVLKDQKNSLQKRA